jgi:hypothetical protein
MALTGRFEFRKTLLGKLVLLVEEDAATSFSRLRRRSTKRRWRRAMALDLAAPEMRPLIDLRSTGRTCSLLGSATYGTIF